MPVDRNLVDLIEKKLKSPPLWEISVEEGRENLARLLDSEITGETVELPSVENVEMGRLYRPQKRGSRPLILYFHGGGFFKGDVDSADKFCRRLSSETDCMVLSAHYRLAPENPFPAAHDDAISALMWVKNLKVKKLAIAGSSAGGNLAAATTIWARDHKSPKITHQILINPIIDFTCRFPSMGMAENEVLITRKDLEWCYDTYYGLDNDLENPRITLTANEDLSKLPATLILTAEFDTLRDEAEDFAAKLKAAKNKVSCKRYSGMIHGFTAFAGLVSQAEQAITDIANFLQ